VENRSKKTLIVPLSNGVIISSCRSILHTLVALLIFSLLCGCMPDSSTERENPEPGSSEPELVEQPMPQPLPLPGPDIDEENYIGPAPATNAGANVELNNEQLEAINPGTSVFVDPVQGLNSGTGTESDPVKTIKEGLSRLAPGMTLLLRGGEYNEQEISVGISGDESSPITIRNYPGEQVVVNASVPQLRSQHASNWELVNSDLGLYRSRSSNFGDGVYTGAVIGDNFQSTTLVPYYDKLAAGARGLEDLSSTVQHVVAGARYVGPGIYNSAGSLYVRLQPIAPEALLTSFSNSTISEDAEAVGFEISNAKHVFSVSGSWIQFQGLVLRGARIGFDVKSTAQHIDFSRNTFHVPGTSIVIRENVRNINIDRCYFVGNFPNHIAWTDMKGGDGQSMPASHWSMKTAGISATSVSDLSVTGSLFGRVFDGLVVTGSHRVVVERNSGYFIDDMAQIGSDSSSVFISNNYIEGAGPSHYGQGDSPFPGTVYISGNIIDSRPEMLWGKNDPTGLLRRIYSGWQPQRPFQSHSASQLLSGDPWKIYHNTVLFAGLTDSEGVGFALWENVNRTGIDHEVLNNIFVNYGAGPFIKDLSTQVGNQVYDGNVYWRIDGEPIVPFKAIGTSQSIVRPETFADYLSSIAFEESTQHYASGWEANAILADPEFQLNFRPSISSPAATGAIPIGDESPIAVRPYRGAVKP